MEEIQNIIKTILGITNEIEINRYHRIGKPKRNKATNYKQLSSNFYVSKIKRMFLKMRKS